MVPGSEKRPLIAGIAVQKASLGLELSKIIPDERRISHQTTLQTCIAAAPPGCTGSRAHTATQTFPMAQSRNLQGPRRPPRALRDSHEPDEGSVTPLSLDRYKSNVGSARAVEERISLTFDGLSGDI